MPYNLTLIMDNSTGLLGFVQGINTELTAGLLGILLLIGISIICFLGFFQFTGDTNRAMAGTSFVTFLLAVLMGAMSLINPLALYLTLIASAIAMAYTWKRS